MHIYVIVMTGRRVERFWQSLWYHIHQLSFLNYVLYYVKNGRYLF
jgi:hypothetical protein